MTLKQKELMVRLQIDIEKLIHKKVYGIFDKTKGCMCELSPDELLTTEMELVESQAAMSLLLYEIKVDERKEELEFLKSKKELET